MSSASNQTDGQQETPFRGLITLSIMLATIMQVLDTTIANVALPHMQGSLSATQEQATWVLTSYIVASAIMTLPTAWLAGRYGRKVGHGVYEYVDGQKVAGSGLRAH